LRSIKYEDNSMLRFVRIVVKWIHYCYGNSCL